jgi:aminodeoxyfutalosine deaminase
VNPPAENKTAQKPKAELHVHLEGSMGIHTLNRVRQRHGEPPIQDSPYGFDGFDAFNRVFLFLSSLLRDEADFHQMAVDFVAHQAADRILYTEASFMPLFHISRGVAEAALFRGIESGLAEGERHHGVTVRLIVSIPRIAGPEAGEKTLALIEKHRTPRMVGIDLAGTETENDVAPFAPTFHKAGDMGLHRVAHAGEFGGSGQVQQAVELLAVERVGHGINAIQDTELLLRLADTHVALEVCPTSNVQLKAVASLEMHPVRRLFDMGVPIVINTDDPAFFDTTLTREFSMLKRHMGFTENEVEKLIANGFQYSFLNPEQKPAVMNERAGKDPGSKAP